VSSARAKADAIAVFGSSEPLAGDPLYESSRRLGRLLASSGREVWTGGYGGVMEGASRGALEAGGSSVGVVCAIFESRQPNRYLSRAVATRDLYERSRTLIESVRGYVVLPGKSGTLAELTLVWALHRAGSLDRRPVVLLGAEWRDLLHHLVHSGMLDSSQLAITRAVGSPEEAMKAIDAFRMEV